MVYHTFEIERIVRAAFDAARLRRGKVTSVDKANILFTSQLWRKTVEQIAKDYPDIQLEHMLVDNCAMQLVRNPKQFDVIVTENMFGDILSDEAAMLTGSIGMLPSASLGNGTAMYEPVHGSAPDIAGQNIANPIATIASVAMMLRYSLNLPSLAIKLESAIESVLSKGFRCADLTQGAKHIVGTIEMGKLIREHISETETVQF
jgi:3-isopropylmalate dehydrogenase